MNVHLGRTNDAETLKILGPFHMRGFLLHNIDFQSSCYYE